MLNRTDKIIHLTSQGVDYKTIAQRTENEPNKVITWLKNHGEPIHYRYHVSAIKNGHRIYFKSIIEASKFLNISYEAIYSQINRWNGYRTEANGILKRVPFNYVQKMDKDDYIYMNNIVYKASDVVKMNEWKNDTNN